MKDKKDPCLAFAGTEVVEQLEGEGGGHLGIKNSRNKNVESNEEAKGLDTLLFLLQLLCGYQAANGGFTNQL